ncbi:decaprenyl-phosphate phosphoribosyltransferase [Candidatus Shapirobacteria bacterium CG08_land_8_20_14_0_20_39_18]|uniref:Decaprenyl-phosphate phosphoribosyltransferase n=1 Tax=Candidatus Shapirobacteria bacterium CG08_land_8_20_14_0_20_39_18 TaxID=1974883 RepID=A0A2M6XCN1_9BACT|nr:MAG: decaprenyl-phosphate phosphoribosyltransferase [Candidatus Shapirobacteria bacterium CG08_land_8_20_14_0_20_39_18]
MVNIFESLIISSRPVQWLKNLSLFAALVFTGNLFSKEKFILVVIAAIIFSILASSIYLFNDVIDVSRDRLHPFKKLRPIAKGDLPIPIALMTAVTGITVSLYLAGGVSFFFFLICLAYFLLQISYSLFLKNLAVIDVLIIATGFILRVYAGALVINVHLSVWFLLCVISTSLFLAVGKRRAELSILSEQAPNHRKILGLYPMALLDQYLSIFASSAWMSWALFTFFQPPPVTQRISYFLHFPQAFAGINKWLMVTIPFVVYGIMRYLKIIYEGEKAESPEKVLLSDTPLLATLVIWAFLVTAIIYAGEL